MENKRRVSRQIHIGEVPIGGDAPVCVQSMTNTDTRDTLSTVAQIERLKDAGCEIVRVAVPDEQAVEAVATIKKAIRIPLIADIHFDYRMAIGAMRAGADAIRINPGNIGGPDKLKKVIEAARERRVPVRIGVNSGSVEKDLLAKYGHPTPEAMVESALRHIKFFEDNDFDLIKVSIKSSDVIDTIDSYRLLARKTDCPFHLGVTEAGTVVGGAVKSALGIGFLLLEGIGDTLRVSLTAPPEEEMVVAYSILRALHLRERGVELVSCPTCGRTEIDLIGLVQKAEGLLKTVVTPLKVAVMGCVVNGPGEAKEADVGIAGGRGVGILFKKGIRVDKVAEAELLDRLIEEVERMTGEKIKKGES
ncbi:MAG: flavodoxin-dependent (E)-4-hydroxy-3-methylbut-2-enyl-diphosphate synthase [Syntrophobacteraceae bacterium]|nr:flavodoxin-dependent (E)-4-hydroxy-3-methylbut-2-enyl-diphosphate synthase [Syntrophobacteraceae bacterium]